MLIISIPGQGDLHIEHVVLDYNGTLAVEGALIAGVGERLNALAGRLLGGAAKPRVHVVTADTFGRAQEALRSIACEVVILPPGNQAEAKRTFVQQLGTGVTACIGNGRNDRLMLEVAALSIVVIESEGASVATLMTADVVVKSSLDALDLLLRPLRLAATLRS
jgi:soluble P-type ATPase